MSTVAPRREADRQSESKAAGGLVFVVALVAACSVFLTLAASRHESTTFDEIAMVAAGARGFETGKWDLLTDHPPLMQYLYGLPVYLTHPKYPAEDAAQWNSDLRYPYAQQFFFREGNDPERMAYHARVIAGAVVALLVLLVWGFATEAVSPVGGLIAAVLVAFLPDVLAHGGVAYNDVPVAAAMFAAAWVLERMMVRPTPRGAATAGLLVAVAVGVKFTAVLLAPIALLLLFCEAGVRGRDPDWRRDVLAAANIGALFTYLGLVAIYRGDFALTALRNGVHFKVAQAAANTGSAPATAWLLGHTSADGFALFFPVAFLLKTPVALHLLIVLGIVGVWVRMQRRSLRLQPEGVDRARWLQSPLRMPALACIVMLPVLIGSDLNIGFRHALPMMPFLLVLVAAGAARTGRTWGWPAKAGVLVLLAGYVASSVSYYPDFLAYQSLYTRGRSPTRPALVDSSLDWGQGLLQLRDFMREEHVERVNLGYFGTALPEGYGIAYRPLPSFYPLPAQPDTGAAPEYTVVSVTNIAGVYLDGDPYAALRGRTPDRVIAHSLLVYRSP